MSTYKTIKIKAFSDVIEELEANVILIPGMLVELMSTGKVKPHATALGDVLPKFVLENALEGDGIDDDIAAGNKAQVWTPNRGDWVYGLLRDEENVAIGDFLESDGEGRLRKYVVESVASADAQQANTIYNHRIVGVAREAVNLSSLPEGSESSAGGDYHNPRILVEIL